MWEDGSLLSVASESFIKAPSYAARLRAFQVWLEATLEASGAKVIAYEEPTAQFRSHAKLAFGMMAIIELAAIRLGCKTFPIHPTRIKKVVTGTGKATKEEVIQEVAKRYPGHGELTSDEADAVAIGVAYYKLHI